LTKYYFCSKQYFTLSENKTTAEHLKLIIRSLPSKPGIYQYFNSEEEIIYVGKAKNLKKRVNSYFTKTHQQGKVRLLVKKINDIKFIVTDSEYDALLLENNLIKKYQPRYNILLKDDKSFPWICIKKESFPRIFPTRFVTDKKSEYYGPYASVKMMKTLLDIIRQLYPIRTCKLNLQPSVIEKKDYKLCLEFHIGNCKGPCVKKQTEEEYNTIIEHARKLIKGNIHGLISDLKHQMNQFAEEMEFEKANYVKEQISLLENYKSKSTIVNPKINNVDVISILEDGDKAYVNYLKVVNGAIVQAHTVEIRNKHEESTHDLLLFAIMDFRNRFNSDSKEIIIPFPIEIDLKDIEITVPQRGDKKQLLDLSRRNTMHFKMERQKQKDLIDPDRHKKRILAKMKEDLRMYKEPKIIECFDNSNLLGTFPVAAMVQFVDARPNKKAYRHFNIKTVEGPDDYASMEEVVYRRYSRLQRENKQLPDLIIVDGGKGQLSSAVNSLKKLDLFGKISIIGIAKRLEEIYYPNDSVPLYLDKTGETLKIIQFLRDEAHRFGITHHRSKRDKGTLKTELTEIKGVGQLIAQKLLLKFKSVKKVKLASLEELASVIGNSKANIVFNHFEEKNKLQ
jgi:excinuclease ABC subunit C